MKKIISLNKIILSAILLLAMSSCKNEPKHSDPVESADEQNEAKFESKDIGDDSPFLTAAAEINIMEIEIGKLALQKSADQNIKNYAQMLIDDHSKSLEELKILASENSITLPVSISDEGREEYNKLNEKSGKEFDKKFADMIEEGHEKAVDKMTEISQKATNPDFKLWASRQISIFLEHHEKAKKLNS